MGDKEFTASHTSKQRESDQYHFSIIIPVLNEREQVNSLIEHLHCQDFEEPYEIIVVDGDPQGGTTKVIQDRNVIPIVSEKKGRGKQMNAGATVACGEVLIFLHADTRLPEMALEKIYDVLQSKKYVGGAFDLAIDSDRLLLKYIAVRASFRSRLNRIPYGDQAIFIRKDYFDRIGRFKEIPLMEDVDLMRRIKKRGDKIIILRDRVKTSARRWETEGALYTTIRNQILVSLYYLGVSPYKLVKFYRLCSNGQVKKKNKSTPSFKQMIENANPQLLKLNRLQTLQVNLGNKCNQHCKHCHIQAGPSGKKIMSKTVMEKIIVFLRSHPDLCIDITGGCPELNPDFKFFVESIVELVSSIMVRTNLTVFYEPGLSWIPQWYCENKIILIASLPCYTDKNVDQQRGQGTFKKSVTAIKLFNDLGYGINKQLQLNLVYNPGADFLPEPQEQLEADYKKELGEKYGVVFDNLFTITNAPIGRFRQYLESNGKLEKYLQLLIENFNHEVAKNIMCRNLLSVDYSGIVYNCDFNQALNLPVTNNSGKPITIEQLDDVLSEGIEITTGEHCFCCTAGAGSSCTGSLVK
jgi:rSAM/selenodomain-associated transferase 2